METKVIVTMKATTAETARNEIVAEIDHRIGERNGQMTRHMGQREINLMYARIHELKQLRDFLAELVIVPD
jgi:hypothetical protein